MELPEPPERDRASDVETPLSLQRMKYSLPLALSKGQFATTWPWRRRSLGGNAEPMSPAASRLFRNETGSVRSKRMSLLGLPGSRRGAVRSPPCSTAGGARTRADARASLRTIIHESVASFVAGTPEPTPQSPPTVGPLSHRVARALRRPVCCRWRRRESA